MEENEVKVCIHNVEGVEPVKGWYECKECGKKLRGAEVKAIKGDYSDLATGIHNVNGKVINKKEDGSVTVVSDQNVLEETKVIADGETPDPAEKEKKKPKKEKVEYEPVQLSSGATVVGPTVVIQCVDCGKDRTIKIQDKFQVTRCMDCQKKHRNKARYEKRKAKMKEKKLENAVQAAEQE